MAVRELARELLERPAVPHSTRHTYAVRNARHGASVETLRRVLEIVEAMTDAAPAPGEKKPPWRPRKEAYVQHLAECGDEGIHRVCLSDKLYNLRATNDDLDEIGDALWERFNSGPQEQLWYYGALGEVFAGGPLRGAGRRGRMPTSWHGSRPGSGAAARDARARMLPPLSGARGRRQRLVHQRWRR